MQSFQKLTPAKADISAYEDAFEFVFTNDDIRNVAIAGPYGSGKSSVLKGFAEHGSFASHKPLAISLTHFNDGLSNANGKGDEGRGVSDSESSQPGASSTEREIEGQLLNQLIHLVDKRKVPKSRFMKTQDASPMHVVFVLAVLTVLAVALVLGLDAPGTMYGGGSVDVRVRIGAWVVVLAVALFVAWRLARGRGPGRFIRKVSFESAEVEVFDKETDSIFNRYLDDILYLLDNCGYDVVAFEDLDRFGRTDTFVKLREINRLLNIRREDERKKERKCRCADRCDGDGYGGKDRGVIRFFYLVSDHMFSVEERVKFFDFIIPVRPHVDPANAEDTLLNKLGPCKTAVPRRLLGDVALFIADARLLNNIINEFLVFRSLFAESSSEMLSIDDEKLFALVVYKNTFPSDFTLLQAGRGYLRWVMGCRQKMVEALGESLKVEASRIDEELARVDEELLTNMAELNLLYSGPWLVDRAVATGNKLFTATRRAESRFDAVQLEGILRENGSLNYDAHLETLEEDEGYRLRKRSIEHKDASARNSAAARKRAIEGRVAGLSGLAFAELAAKCAVDVFDLFGETLKREGGSSEGGSGDGCGFADVLTSPRFDLVKALVLNGYIDESYEHYMSAFRPGALSESDEWFLRNAAAGQPVDPGRALDNPQEVLVRIEEHHFRQRGTRCYALTQALIADGDVGKRRAFAEQLAADGGAAYIVGYARSSCYEKAIFEDLAQYWPSMIEEAFAGSSLSPGDLREFTWALLSDAGLTRDMQGRYAAMYAFIETDERFLCVRDERAAGIGNAIAELDLLKVGFVSPDGVNADLRRVVYKYGRYSPTAAAVCQMLAEECGERGVGPSNMITRAHAHAGAPIKAFVRDHMSELLDDCLVGGDFEFRDSEQAVLWVLNDVTVDEGLLEAYFAALPNELIGSLADVRDRNVWEALLRGNVVAASAENVFLYVSDWAGSFDEAVSEFVNEHGIFDSNPDVVQRLFEEEGVFVEAVLGAEGLKPGMAAQMLSDAQVVLTVLPAKGISEELVAALVAADVVEMNGKTLVQIRGHFGNVLYGFIARNVAVYEELLESGEAVATQGEIESVLELESIPINRKVALVRAFGEQLVPYPTFGDEVNEVIVTEFLDEDAAGHLPALYEAGGPELRAAIDGAYVRMVSEGVQIGAEVPRKSCLAIMQAEELSDKVKRDALADLLGGYSRDQVVECLTALDEDALADVVAGHAPSRKIELTPGVPKLIEALKIAGMCGTARPLDAISVQLYANRERS